MTQWRQKAAYWRASEAELSPDFFESDWQTSDRKKLLSEEYRACSVRADELTRVTWQTFIAVMALAGAASAGLVRALEQTSAGESLFLFVVSVLVVFLLRCWRLIAQRWNLQQKGLYFRLDFLEVRLGFRTNAQFHLLDLQHKLKPATIGRLRGQMAWALVLWWAILGSRAAYRFFESIARQSASFLMSGGDPGMVGSLAAVASFAGLCVLYRK